MDYGVLKQYKDIIISFHLLLKVHTHVILKYDLVYYGIQYGIAFEYIVEPH